MDMILTSTHVREVDNDKIEFTFLYMCACVCVYMNETRRANAALLVYSQVVKQQRAVSEEYTNYINNIELSLDKYRLRICCLCYDIKHESEFDVLYCTACNNTPPIGGFVCADECWKLAYTYRCHECMCFGIMRDHEHEAPVRNPD
jgi:hypothetical protein